MTKRFFATLRYTALVAIVASLFVMSSCDSGDDAEPVFDGTVTALIASDAYKQANTGSPDNALDSLVKYLNMYPDLAAQVNAASEVTLFAPSNTAFKNLLETPGFPTKFSLISPDLIKGVLQYHIVMAKKMKADLTSGVKVPTLYLDAGTTNAAQITVNNDGTLSTGSSNPNIDIVVPDIQAKNGIVHIVESVMVPPTVGAALIPILGKMAGTVMLGKDFTLLARLVARADAGFVEDPSTLQFKMITWLALAQGTTVPGVEGAYNGGTFFAIPNAAFDAAAAAQEVTSIEFIDSFTTGANGTARALLLNHFAVDRYMVTLPAGDTDEDNTFQLANNTTVEPLGAQFNEQPNLYVSVGEPSATVPYGVVLSNTPANENSFRPIVQKDIVHTNGVIQVFYGLFLPVPL